ncbi:MAG: hypothetical protein HN673_10460, partial [Rhodospirillales bacterium]|nr:hypothetical protein [Rhodospirillales bacterium]
ISGFGLLELSRQRLRPSIIESTSESCPHCEGTGIRRSTESTALNILRAIEEEGTRKRLGAITVYVPTAVALYILNQKRQMLADIEGRYEFAVTLEADDALIPPNHRIERTESGVSRPEAKAKQAPQQPAEKTTDSQSGEQSGDGSEEAPRKRRRRRGRRRKSSQNAATETPNVSSETTATTEESSGDGETSQVAASSTEEGEAAPKRRRRGRRGGRKRRPANEAANEETGNVAVEATDGAPASDGNEATADAATTEPAKEAPTEAAASDENSAEKKPRRRRRRSPKKADEGSDSNTASVATKTDETKEEAPKVQTDIPVAAAPDVKEPAPVSSGASTGGNVVNVGGTAENSEEEDAPRRRGWWQRLTE